MVDLEGRRVTLLWLIGICSLGVHQKIAVLIECILIFSMPSKRLKNSLLLPKHIGVLFLSLGDDGHIAFLFPNGSLLDESLNTAVSVAGREKLYRRFTIIPPVNSKV